MDVATESAPRTTPGHKTDESMGARTIPIITTSSPTPIIKMSAPSPMGDPMDISTPTNPLAPRSLNKNSDGDGSDSNDRQNIALSGEQTANSASSTMPAPAAAAVHQPKIVQTAFIHKLYKCVRSRVSGETRSTKVMSAKVLIIPQHVGGSQHTASYQLV